MHAIAQLYQTTDVVLCMQLLSYIKFWLHVLCLHTFSYINQAVNLRVVHAIVKLYQAVDWFVHDLFRCIRLLMHALVQMC